MTLVDRVGAQDRPRGHDGRFGVADFGVRAVEIAADPDRAAAGASRRVDDAAVVEEDALPFDGDAAAALAGGQAGGVDLAGDGDDPLAAAVDDDPPLAAADRLRLDDAGHVEHGVGEGAARRRPHLDRAAVGLDPTELLQPVLRFGGAGLEEQQAVALDVDRDGVGRDQADPAAVGDDRAGVGDARPGQDHGAAGRRDRAFVAHLAALRRARRARPR